MTDEQLKKLTLGDLERIASRFAAAVKSIREGQALLNPASADAGQEVGPRSPLDESAPLIIDPAAEHRRRQFQPVDERRPRGLQTDPRAHLTPADRAAKEALLRGRGPVDPNLPEDMQRLEQGEHP